MRLRLRTKFTLVMTSLVLFVVAVLSYIFAAQFLEQLIHETDKRANDLAEQVFLQAKHALTEAARQGFQLSSDAPEEVRVYVRHAFEISQGLHTHQAVGVGDLRSLDHRHRRLGAGFDRRKSAGNLPA